MFDFRYHLVSLAAVFIALAVGILLGAAISGKLGDAEDSLMKDRIAALNDQLAQERTRSDLLERRGEAAQELVTGAYPTLMENRLEGQDVAVLFLGPVDGGVRSATERTLIDAGAGSSARLVALDTPIDPEELDSALEGDEQLARYAQGGGDFGDLGEALGEDLVKGEGTPLWTSLSSRLVEERSGTISSEVEGVVVIQTWHRSEDADADQQAKDDATQSLFEGLVRGLENTGVPVVGAQATSAPDEDLALFRQQGVSSVDDVDTLPGRLALALLLGGAEPGHYGVKDSATDGVAPPVEPVPTTTGG